MKLLFLFSALVLIQPGPTPKELTQKAIEFYEKRDYMEAVIHLNKAIEIDPTYFAIAEKRITEAQQQLSLLEAT